MDLAETPLDKVLFADLEYRSRVIEYMDASALLTVASGNTVTANLMNDLDRILDRLKIERSAQARYNTAALSLIDAARRILTDERDRRDADAVADIIRLTAQPRARSSE